MGKLEVVQIISEVPLSKRSWVEARFFAWVLAGERIGLAYVVNGKSARRLLLDVANLHDRIAKGETVTDMEVKKLHTQLRRQGKRSDSAGDNISSTSLLCAYYSTFFKARDRVEVALSWADNAYAYYGGGGFAMPAAAADFFEKAEAKAREICIGQ